MRLLAYAHPAILREGAEFNGGWTVILSQMLVPVCRRDPDVHLTILLGSRFLEHVPSDLPQNVSVATVDEIALHRELSASGCTLGELSGHIMKSQWQQPSVRCLLRHVQGALASNAKFDAVISFAVKAGWMRELWPDAIIFHTEMGPFAKAPFPRSLFLDSEGIYDGSTIMSLAKSKRLPTPSKDAVAWLKQFRQKYEYVLTALSPFDTDEILQNYSQSYLLPLQVSGSFTFDEIVRYRSQLEYAIDVLAQTPDDIGVMVTEYTEWSCLLDSRMPTNSWKSLRRFPNFVKLSRNIKINSPSPYIVPLVDGVWTTSSNLAWHAILWQKKLGVPATGFHAPLADNTAISDFCDTLSASAPQQRDELLVWALGHYYIPFALCMDPNWLNTYLQSRIALSKGKSSWRDRYFKSQAEQCMINYPPIADWNVLNAAWSPQLPEGVDGTANLRKILSDADYQRPSRAENGVAT